MDYIILTKFDDEEEFVTTLCHGRIAALKQLWYGSNANDKQKVFMVTSKGTIVPAAYLWNGYKHPVDSDEEEYEFFEIITMNAFNRRLKEYDKKKTAQLEKSISLADKSAQ
jgi:hypothetical protein